MRTRSIHRSEQRESKRRRKKGMVVDSQSVKTIQRLQRERARKLKEAKK